jgi:hypothetical protein
MARNEGPCLRAVALSPRSGWSIGLQSSVRRRLWLRPGGRPAGARVMAKASAIHPARQWLDSLGYPALLQSTKTGKPVAAQSWLLSLAGSLGSAGRSQRECHPSRPGCGGLGGWGGSLRPTAGIEGYILRWAFVDTTPGGLRSHRRHL